MEVASRSTGDPRQFDIPLTTQYHFITPTDVPGRITTEDFLFFENNPRVNFFDYDVVVESYNGKFKRLGRLNSSVQLPHTHFLNDALIVVVPRTDATKPRFVGTVQRGKVYLFGFNEVNGIYLLK